MGEGKEGLGSEHPPGPGAAGMGMGKGGTHLSSGSFSGAAASPPQQPQQPPSERSQAPSPMGSSREPPWALLARALPSPVSSAPPQALPRLWMRSSRSFPTASAAGSHRAPAPEPGAAQRQAGRRGEGGARCSCSLPLLHCRAAPIHDHPLPVNYGHLAARGARLPACTTRA